MDLVTPWKPRPTPTPSPASTGGEDIQTLEVIPIYDSPIELSDDDDEDDAVAQRDSAGGHGGKRNSLAADGDACKEAQLADDGQHVDCGDDNIRRRLDVELNKVHQETGGKSSSRHVDKADKSPQQGSVRGHAAQRDRHEPLHASEVAAAAVTATAIGAAASATGSATGASAAPLLVQPPSPHPKPTSRHALQSVNPSQVPSQGDEPSRKPPTDKANKDKPARRESSRVDACGRQDPGRSSSTSSMGSSAGTPDRCKRQRHSGETPREGRRKGGEGEGEGEEESPSTGRYSLRLTPTRLKAYEGTRVGGSLPVLAPVRGGAAGKP